MRRAYWLLAFALLFVPGAAHAIQLHWSSGADTLTFTEATRAILVLRADSAEVTLPPEWRLLWVGDSTEVEVVELDSLEVCEGDTAQVYGVDGPATPEDSTANLVTAHFCSGGSESAEKAVFQLDLPAWGRGKCKVVALDPADSTSVLESNEVTFNGGVSDPFEPVVFTASQSRSSDIVSVTAVGTGLATVQQSSIVASDSSWVVPLALVQRTASSLTATASVPASLPPALLEVATGRGQVASAPLSGDEVMAPTGDYSYGKFHDPIPGTRPKDFSFFYDNLGHFHLFFINTIAGMPSDNPVNERYFGHVSGTGLRDDWTPNPPDTSFHVYGTGWEGSHVWAPTIVQHGPTYYMFYTGVDAQLNQSIGVTTASNINATSVAWSRPGTQILSRDYVQWIEQAGSAQCRDPFVMRAPFDSTRYMMLYSTMYYDSVSHTSKTTIGVAWQSSNALTQHWHDAGRLQITDVPSAALNLSAESPHAFIHVNARGDTSYYVCASGNDAAFPGRDRLLRNRQSPWDVSADTTANHWNLISSVYDQLGFAQLDQVVFEDFNASEYCKMYNHEYLAGVNASLDRDSTFSIWITMFEWINGGSGPDVMALLGPVTEVDDGERGGAPAGEQLRLLGRSPGNGSVVLEMTVPRAEHVELTIYDVAGRVVKQLASGTQLRGSWRLSWDGRDESGNAAGSGVYFARMAWPGGARVTRVVVLR